MSDGKQVVKIPIRSMEEYRFRFNYNKSKQVGQGSGNSKVGDVIAREPAPGKGPGKGSGAGDQPGTDYYEAEISLEELEEILFSEMSLPGWLPNNRTRFRPRTFGSTMSAKRG